MAAALRQEWDRQPGEPSRAYAAFCSYRDLPAVERSLNAAYGTETGRKNTADLRAPGYWADWSSAWHWVERAASYDAWCDSERRRVREQRMRELAERRADVEFANQADLEQWLRDLDTKLRDVIARGFEEVEREFARDSDGTLIVVKEKKRTKFPAFGAIARLLRERNETARQAIEGPQLRPPRSDHALPGDAPSAADVPVSEIAWVPPKEEPPPPPKGEGEK